MKLLPYKERQSLAVNLSSGLFKWRWKPAYDLDETSYGLNILSIYLDSSIPTPKRLGSVIEKEGYDLSPDPEEVFKGAMSCVDNEAKSSVVFTFDQKLTRIPEIRDRILEYCNTFSGSSMLYNRLFLMFLVPYSFVTRYNVSSINSNFFYPTEACLEMGIPLATYYLTSRIDKPLEHSTIFGTDEMPDDYRAYKNTRIIEMISPEGTAFNDMYQQSGFFVTTLQRYLSKLKKAGAVDFEGDVPINPRKKLRIFSWTPNKNPDCVLDRRKGLVRKIANSLVDVGPGDYNSITARLGHGWANNVHAALTSLEQSGFVTSEKINTCVIRKGPKHADFMEYITGMREIVSGGDMRERMMEEYHRLQRNEEEKRRIIGDALLFFNKRKKTPGRRNNDLADF